MATRVKKAVTPRSSSAATGKVLYFYGVSQPRSGQKPPRIAVPGIDGLSPVESLVLSGLLCWISEVDGDEYGSDLARKMEDMEWLTDASVRHQRVVSTVAASESLLPARFGTVFLSRESLSADVEDRKKSLLAAFKRVANSDEWGVKVFINAPERAVVLQASSGRDYLEKKASALAQPSRTAPDGEIEQLAAELGKIARASTVTSRVSGGLRGLQWQATFLLPRSRRKQWDQVLKRYASKWEDSRTIESSGPWPPYSFVAE